MSSIFCKFLQKFLNASSIENYSNLEVRMYVIFFFKFIIYAIEITFIPELEYLQLYGFDNKEMY